MNFKSEIRNSVIDTLIEKAAQKNFGKYLSKIYLNKVRAFDNQDISFDFPVTAIISTNGGGKTTILGAAAIIYRVIPPKKYFARGGNLDNDMRNWQVQYDLIDKNLNARDIIKRTANFKNLKWNRSPLEREVLDFGVSRTVPPIEKNEFNRFANRNMQFQSEQTFNIDAQISANVSKILGKDISNFKYIRFSSEGRIEFLSGVNKTGAQYSEFHFGAGESSIIRMVAQIEAAQENSLVLIEEIENGLHPVATIKMVEYLIDVAERKKIQTIFTTHSNDALKPLPAKAVWASIDGKLFQGKLDIHSLRTISGQIDSKLAIFVEDKFAKLWIESILRSDENIALDHIQIHSVSGDGNAVNVHKYHNINPSLSGKFPSVCFIDGDSKQKEDTDKRIFRLPGEFPESYIYNAVLDRIAEFKVILAASLHKRPDFADKLENVIKEVKINNRDYHLLYSQVGIRLGLIPEELVMMAFLTVWTQAYDDISKKVLEPIADLIPKEVAYT